MKLGITKKLVLVFVLGLLCLAGIGYRLYRTNHTGPAQPLPPAIDQALPKALNSLRASINDLETAELGYALSGEKPYKKAVRAAATQMQRSLGDMKSLSEDAPARHQNILQIEPMITQRILFSEQVIKAREKKGQKKAHAQIKTGFGRELSAHIETGLSGLEQDNAPPPPGADASQKRSGHASSLLIAAAYGIAIVMVIAAIVLVGRAMPRRETRTVRGLQEQLTIYSEGLKDHASILLDPDGRITDWNAAALRLTGFGPVDVNGRHLAVLFPDEDVRLGKPDGCLKTAQAEGRCEIAGACLRKDGPTFPARWIVSAIKDEENGLEGFSVLIRDVTELKRAEELLTKLSLSVEQAADLVVIANREGKVEFVNKAVEEVTGYSRDEFLAGGMDLLQAENNVRRDHAAMWEILLAGQQIQAEVMYTRKNGEFIYLDEIATPIKDSEGSVTHVVFTGRDLTPVKLMRDKVDFLSSYDALTGLPNRTHFDNRLARDIAREGATAMAILAIDIDRFKYINEIYGLEAGNKVLQQVAESLSVSVSKGDMVCRLGSDEFGMMLHDIDRPADVLLFVKMIMKNVPQIIMSGGEEIAVTLAIGIAMFPADGQVARTLMKNADTALSKAKDLGRNHYQFYTADMNLGVSELVFMERRLSEALRNREFVLTFQPYYHLSTRKVAGAEALLKWNNNEFGLVSPAKFIPMLEETGMIIDVGTWALKTACRQIKQWNSTNGPRVPIAVNLSPSQFLHEYLVETVESSIREAGIDPHHLTLEITESTFMKNQEYAISILRRLKELGVSISIDDFGTGYSSLSYLKKFPVDYVKIDQSFIKDVALDPDATSLVSAIIQMTHSLNLKTIAEGIETEEQWKLLRLLKCDMAQGFYFSHAVSPEELERLLG
jgi:diguanylate cyclase (GGDEF)-like protein/PAS domain S-box-containing protein